MRVVIFPTIYSKLLAQSSVSKILPNTPSPSNSCAHTRTIRYLSEQTDSRFAGIHVTFASPRANVDKADPLSLLKLSFSCRKSRHVLARETGTQRGKVRTVHRRKNRQDTVPGFSLDMSGKY